MTSNADDKLKTLDLLNGVYQLHPFSLHHVLTERLTVKTVKQTISLISVC